MVYMKKEPNIDEFLKLLEISIKKPYVPNEHEFNYLKDLTLGELYDIILKNEESCSVYGILKKD